MGPGQKGCNIVGSRGTAVGTYQYRAPELFAKDAACSYACDVWALGTSFVHMETELFPFGKERMLRSHIGAVVFSRRGEKGINMALPGRFRLIEHPKKASRFPRALAQNASQTCA